MNTAIGGHYPQPPTTTYDEMVTVKSQQVAEQSQKVYEELKVERKNNASTDVMNYHSFRRQNGSVKDILRNTYQEIERMTDTVRADSRNLMNETIEVDTRVRINIKV